jgi:hypothetical protein
MKWPCSLLCGKIRARWRLCAVENYILPLFMVFSLPVNRKVCILRGFVKPGGAWEAHFETQVQKTPCKS